MQAITKSPLGVGGSGVSVSSTIASSHVNTVDNFSGPLSNSTVFPFNRHDYNSCNNNNILNSSGGKPQKVKPTPSWGGTCVGDYPVLPTNNGKQIALWGWGF